MSGKLAVIMKTRIMTESVTVAGKSAEPLRQIKQDVMIQMPTVTESAISAETAAVTQMGIGMASVATL